MNLVISGSVIVIFIPERIWDTNNGITDPRLAITLPYRTEEITVSLLVLALATITFSIIAFEIPMALMGYTLLSVLSQLEKMLEHGYSESLI